MSRVVAAAVVVGIVLVAATGSVTRAQTETPAATASPKPVVTSQEPPILKAIMDAGWHLEAARPQLPAVQVVHRLDQIESEDWTEYAYDGGALRLCVSASSKRHGRGSKSDNVFAILVDTRQPKYSDFNQLPSTPSYTVDHHGPYVLVMPLRPIDTEVFHKLQTKQWTEDQLQRVIGRTSYHYCQYCRNGGPERYFHLSFVPEGLLFEGKETHGDGSEVTYQLGNSGPPLPPFTTVSALDYGDLQRKTRDAFAKMLFWDRDATDQIIADGQESPDGRFVVGYEGTEIWWEQDVVIRERDMPERYYRMPQRIRDKDILWLNDHTVLLYIFDLEDFCSIDAISGEVQYVARVEWPKDFGISGPHQFWYISEDDQKHTINIPKRPSRRRPSNEIDTSYLDIPEVPLVHIKPDAKK